MNITKNITNSEMRLMEIIWQSAPIKSGELAARAFTCLGWKKSTVYTVLKKLALKGAVENIDSVVTPLCTKDEVMSSRSDELIANGYSGSLPMFLAAFLKKEKLAQKEAEELKGLIDRFTEEE